MESTPLTIRDPNKSPLVSVIIPTYNRAQYICEAVKSVLRQTFSDFELIVVDDGSVDNTKEILTPYLGIVKYIYQNNSGIAAARNAGIEMSRGEFIAFLDSDDLWVRDKLQLQVHLLRQQSKLAMVYADYCIFDNNLSDLSFCHHVTSGSTKRKQYGDVFIDLIMNCHISTVTVMLRKEVFQDVGIFDTSFTTGEDYDLWLRIAASHPIGYLPRIVSLVRHHDANITANRLLPELPGEIRAIEKALRMFPAKAANLHAQQLTQRLSNIYFMTGFAAFSADRYPAARFHLRKAVMTAPFRLKPLLYLVFSLICPGLSSRFISHLRKSRVKAPEPRGGAKPSVLRQ